MRRAAWGVDKATLLEWLARGRRSEQPFADFADRVAKADGEAESRMVAVVVKAAEDGSWQVAKAWLELRRGVWRMRKPVEPKEPDYTQKTDEELETEIRAWLAERDREGRGDALTRPCARPTRRWRRQRRHPRRRRRQHRPRHPRHRW